MNRHISSIEVLSTFPQDLGLRARRLMNEVAENESMENNDSRVVILTDYPVYLCCDVPTEED